MATRTRDDGADLRLGGMPALVRTPVATGRPLGLSSPDAELMGALFMSAPQDSNPIVLDHEAGWSLEVDRPGLYVVAVLIEGGRHQFIELVAFDAAELERHYSSRARANGARLTRAQAVAELTVELSRDPHPRLLAGDLRYWVDQRRGKRA